MPNSMSKVISLHFLKNTFTLEAVYQYGKTEIFLQDHYLLQETLS